MSSGTYIGAGIGLIAGLALSPWIGPTGVIIAMGLGAGVGSLLDPIKQPSPGRPEEEEFEYTTNQEGKVIPEVLGCQRLTGNLMHYWGFRKEEITREVGGKGGGGGEDVVVNTKYHLSWVMAVCMGPVTSILSIHANNTCVWSGNAPVPTEEEIAAGTWYREIWVGMSPIVENYMYDMAYDDGGKKGSPSVDAIPPAPALQGRVLLFYGIPEQQILPLPSRAWGEGGIPISYANQCVLYFDDCSIGQSMSMPSVFVGLAKVPPNFDECRQQIKTVEYNPAWAIYYILTSMIKFPREYVDYSSFRTAALILSFEDFGIGMLMNQSTTALTWIENILRHIDAVMFWGTEGKLQLKLLRGADWQAGLPVVDENTVLEPIEFERPGWLETINQYKVLYPLRMDCFCEPQIRQEPIVKGMSFAAGQYGTGCGIWMWGDNARGETGIGNNLQTQWQPRTVIGIDPWTMQPYDFIKYWNFGYAAPFCSSTAIGMTCEALWTWGSNNYGQLGNGTWENSSSPVMVNPPDTDIPFWKDIANGIGAWHMCALDYNGHAHCWGANWFGGLGNGVYDLYHTQDSNVPVRVLGNHVFKQISVGFHHTLAIKEDGTCYAWGGNQWGELGINQPSESVKASPVQVMTTVKFLNVYAGHSFSVGLSEDYQVWCWGSDSWGQCGQDVADDGLGIEWHVPMSLKSDMLFKSVVTGRGHCVALAFDGSVWCWGSNIQGECGQDINVWWPGVDNVTGGAQDLHWHGTPVSVKGNFSFQYIGAGYDISYGIKNDGSIWFWGDAIYGGIDWTGRELSGGEGDVGYIGYEDGDQTGKWCSEDPYGLRVPPYTISYPTESQWYREFQFPAGYHRNMGTPGVWYYHNDDYDFSYPEGCYWIIELNSASPLTITAELLAGSSSFDLRVFWDGRLASGDDGASIAGYTAISYHAIDSGIAGDTLVVASPLVQAGKYKPLMYWKSGTAGYRIKYELTYGSSSTTTTTA